MVKIVPAVEDDISRIAEIETDAFAPPWTVGALLSELYREDSFFAVACISASEKTTVSSSRNPECDARIQNSGVRSQNSCVRFADGYNLPHSRAVPVGFVILRCIADDGELLQIAVDRDARRCGVADLLMNAALEYAQEEKIKAVFLEVRKSNDAAVALYKKHGFKSVRLRKDYYSNPLEDALVLVREL